MPQGVRVQVPPPALPRRSMMKFFVHKVVFSEEKRRSFGKKVLAMSGSIAYDRFRVITKFTSRVSAKYALSQKH